jgi:hypothetical protein
MNLELPFTSQICVLTVLKCIPLVKKRSDPNRLFMFLLKILLFVFRFQMTGSDSLTMWFSCSNSCV